MLLINLAMRTSLQGFPNSWSHNTPVFSSETNLWSVQDLPFQRPSPIPSVFFLAPLHTTRHNHFLLISQLFLVSFAQCWIVCTWHRVFYQEVIVNKHCNSDYNSFSSILFCVKCWQLGSTYYKSSVSTSVIKSWVGNISLHTYLEMARTASPMAGFLFVIRLTMINECLKHQYLHCFFSFCSTATATF